MMLRTAFTDLVGCKVPIQLAPMGAICTPELVGAVTSAGAMGMTGMPMAPAPVVADVLDGLVAAVEGPVGFNVLLPFLDVEVVEVASARCRYVDFYHGAVDASLVQRVHDSGALAGWQVGAVDEARAAALAAGAAGVRMGTRFVASVESGAHPAYKDALVAAAAGDTVLTDEFRVGWPDDRTAARVLRSALERNAALGGEVTVGQAHIGPMTLDIPRFGFVPPTATAEGDIGAMAMYAGESAALVDVVEPAAEIVTRTARQAEDCLRRAAPI